MLYNFIIAVQLTFLILEDITGGKILPLLHQTQMDLILQIEIKVQQ